MTETLVFSLLFVAATAFYGTARIGPRGGPRLASTSSKPRRMLVRAAALGAVGVAGLLWHEVEPGPAAVFVVVVGLMVMGTLVAVLGSLAPRVIWTLSLLVLVLIPVLGAFRGLQ